MSLRRSSVALAACLFASPAFAQSAVATHVSSAPTGVAVRRTTAVVIDGVIDEAAWQQATPITQFRQYIPTEGAAASLPTEVRILFDEDALYIGARMSEPGGRAAIRAPLARRDQLLPSNGNNGAFNSLTTDKLAIDIDPYHNHIDDAWFEVNPAGVKGEQFNGDPSWDPIWEAATHVDAEGWTAEMRIPYSQLRFSRDSVQMWGLQIWRYVDRLNEQDMWSFRKRNENSGPGYFGHLDGLVISNHPRQLEVLPYVVSREQFKYADKLDPYHDRATGKISAGGDLKYNLTSNLTLDATFNPDFGQVEVDPASLNLSAYETFYDEKRPFFVANRSAFSFGGTSCYFCNNFSGLSLFYSRRIGRPPQLTSYVGSRAAFMDAPDDATILGATKLTGRTSRGYTVGILDAVTNDEVAHYVTTAGGAQFDQRVEPRTNYFMSRVKKELRGGATTVGFAATSTIRALGGDSTLVNRLRDNASALGFDFSHAWSNRMYRWRGSVVASDVRGSASAIAATQRSSTHFFQRPDREVSSDGVFSSAYDTTATALRGYGFYTRLAKETGNWNWEVQQNWRSPGFEVNDMSFLDRTDYKWMNGNLQRIYTKPTRWYRSMGWTAGAQQQFNYDGDRTDADAHVFYAYQFLNYWNIRTFAIRYFSNYDDRATRGGPVVRVPGASFGHFQVSTDPRQRAVFDFTIRGSRGDDSTHSFQFAPGAALKPASNIFIQLSPVYAYSERKTQYVRTQNDASATLFYGKRYLFSNIATRTVSLDTRLNWTMRTDLTLQLFAQPFVASGDYRDFREFAAPRTVKQVVYGKDAGTVVRNANGTYTLDPDGSGAAAPYTINDPNFTVRSLRGTAVMRWEYRPGSTVFFVWTQQRSGSSAYGDVDFGRDSRAIFTDRPDNVFQVKATYWIGR